jgi:arylsulfatase A-like enzyme
MMGQRRVVLVVCDSLRADLVDEASAPTLWRLRREAASFSAFRSTFPSTTRTSAACIATGCTPAAHGLLGNTMVLDEGEGLRCFSVGKPDFLQRLRKVTGRALHRPTMHERVRPIAPGVLVSNVSPGAAYVQDPEHEGYVYHRSGSFGPGGEPLADGLSIGIGVDGDRAMTDRFCAEVLRERRPAYAVMWLSEPDHTGHHTPLGSPEHRGAIAEADRNVDQVLRTVDELEREGDSVLLAVCSDHGMQTVRRKIDIDAELVAAGFKASPTSGDIVAAPQGTSVLLHFAPEARSRIPAVTEWLRARDFAGEVIEAHRLADVGLPVGGSLALAVNLAGDDEPNEFGVRGRSDVAENALGGESLPGHGQHGGLARYEQQPFLAIRGGGIAAGSHDTPASLIDLAPTFLRHLGLPAEGTEGRAL